jgi:hypothetical protein
MGLNYEVWGDKFNHPSYLSVGKHPLRAGLPTGGWRGVRNIIIDSPPGQEGWISGAKRPKDGVVDVLTDGRRREG